MIVGRIRSQRSDRKAATLRAALMLLTLVTALPSAAEALGLVCRYEFSTDDKGVRTPITGEETFLLDVSGRTITGDSSRCRPVVGFASASRFELACDLQLDGSKMRYEDYIDRVSGKIETFVSFSGKVALYHEGHCELQEPKF